MAICNSYNFRVICDRITTSGVVGGNRLKGLQIEGYEALINLLPDDNEHAVPSEANVVAEQGVEYHYIPVDFAAPNQEDYEKFLLVMQHCGDRKLHIHCAANWRVSAFYAAYAEQRNYWTREQGDELIAGLWSPGQYPPWSEFLSGIRARR